jgi:hypothetical protein
LAFFTHSKWLSIDWYISVGLWSHFYACRVIPDHMLATVFEKLLTGII